jgi:vesicle coat complex subunit
MSQYFNSSSKRDEINEYAKDLNSPNFDKKREALKKVIALMTVGKDVSPLFQSVIKCLEVNDLEIIKLVYLYIINYSRAKPDDAIMVVELFRRSTKNMSSPLIRALAVRTMGYIRVKRINEYLIEPLKELLADEDPYVKKTAILCVPKVYEVTPDLIEKHDVIKTLQKMVTKEGNTLVLANLIACFHELSEMRGSKKLLPLNSDLVQKLLLAINECIEWGQVFILECLADYVPADVKEAESIVDRVLPRLSHVNPSVVLTSVRVILKCMDHMTSAENIKALSKKIAPSMIGLLAGQPEVQYVALRNFSFICEKYPHILDKNIKVFFIKFNDPYFVKLEKLHMISKLTDNKNFETVLTELVEYTNDVDIEFGRKAMKAIGRICVKVDKAAEKCLSILKAVIQAGSQAIHILAEACVVLQIIYRKYPERFTHDESFKTLVENLSNISEPEPRGSLVWIIGEFAERIPGSVEIIKGLGEYFSTESASVQLQVLTATVKLFLKLPDDAEDLVATILPLATENNENPDVRDRGYIYWRLLSTDTEKAKRVVLSEKPIIQEEVVGFEENLMTVLINNISTVASVFHKRPETFLPKLVLEGARRYVEEVEEEYYEPKPEGEETKKEKSPGKTESKKEKTKEEAKADTTKAAPAGNDFDLLGMDDFGSAPTATTSTTTEKKLSPPPQTTTTAHHGDLLDLDFGGSSGGAVTTSHTQPVSQPSDNFDFFDSPAPTVVETTTLVPYEVVLNESTKGQGGNTGLRVEASVLREGSNIVLGLKVRNTTGKPVSGFVSQIKPNYFGLTVDKFPDTTINPQETREIKANIGKGGNRDTSSVPKPPLTLTVGLKNSLDVFYLTVNCMFHILLEESGQLSAQDFKSHWKQIPDSNELTFDVQNVCNSAKTPEGLQQVMKRNNIFLITSRKNDKQQDVMYFTAKGVDQTYFLVEISLPSLKSKAGCSISCRSQNQGLIPLFLQCSQFVLSNS